MIRPATIWDAPTIVRMWEEMMSEVEHLKDDRAEAENFYLHLMVRIKSPEHKVFVAEEDGCIVGFITGFVSNAEYSTKKIGLCDNAFVAKTARGKKVYFDLIRALYKEAVDMGVEEMRFQFRYDPRMINVWQRMGFTPSFLIYKKEVV